MWCSATQYLLRSLCRLGVYILLPGRGDSVNGSTWKTIEMHRRPGSCRVAPLAKTSGRGAMAVEGVSRRPSRGLPLRDIRVQGLVRYECGEGWFRVVAKRVRAGVKHPPDAFACRLGGNDGLLQVAHGDALLDGARLNSLYSPSTDTGMTFGGVGVALRRNARTGGYEVRTSGSLEIRLSRTHMRRLGHPWYDGPVDQVAFSASSIRLVQLVHLPQGYR